MDKANNKSNLSGLISSLQMFDDKDIGVLTHNGRNVYRY